MSDLTQSARNHLAQTGATNYNFEAAKALAFVAIAEALEDIAENIRKYSK
jgi:hypothetical protein